MSDRTKPDDQNESPAAALDAMGVVPLRIVQEDIDATPQKVASLRAEATAGLEAKLEVQRLRAQLTKERAIGREEGAKAATEFVRLNALAVWDMWKSLECPGTWPEFLAASVTAATTPTTPPESKHGAECPGVERRKLEAVLLAARCVDDPEVADTALALHNLSLALDSYDARKHGAECPTEDKP